MTGVAQITMIDARFVFRSMLPSRCQLLIRRPKVRCSCNQLLRRSEDRANAKAATSRKGVVGNRGRTKPTAPTATEVRPVNNQMKRVSIFTTRVHHMTTGSGKSSGTRSNQSACYATTSYATMNPQSHFRARLVTRDRSVFDGARDVTILTAVNADWLRSRFYASRHRGCYSEFDCRDVVDHHAIDDQA
jgi:hypothetical protein